MVHDSRALRPLLNEIQRRVGSGAEFCRRVAVDGVPLDSKTRRTWFDDVRTVAISPGHVAAIWAAASQLNIDTTLFEPVSAIWDLAGTYAENRARTIDSGADLRVTPYHMRVCVPALGLTLRSPFGASSSICTCSPDRIAALARAGCDALTGKTTRSQAVDPLPPPNLAVVDDDIDLAGFDGRSTPTVKVVAADETDIHGCNTANSYAMPTSDPETYAREFRQSLDSLRDGQVLIASIVGSARLKAPLSTLVEDFVATARIVIAAGATVIEVNLSCPNSYGREGLIYQDIAAAKEILRVLRGTFPSVKILAKLGYLRGPKLEQFADMAQRYVNGSVTMNSLSVHAVTPGLHGPVPFFGAGRPSGLSGPAILPLGLQMVETMARWREANGGRNAFAIFGVGGVTVPEDVSRYLNAGADIVQATRIFLEDRRFGLQVQRHLRETQPARERRREDEEELAFFNLRTALRARAIQGNGSARRVGLDFLSRWMDQNETEVRTGYRRASVPTAADIEAHIRRELGLASL